MKTKHMSKKLSLSKTTVASLNDHQMNNSLGGANTACSICRPDTEAEDCTVGCPTLFTCLATCPDTCI